MARRRKRRRKSSYEDVGSETAEGSSAVLVAEELSPRARRLVEGGVIDLNAIAGSGESGKITSGDILHAARLMEVEQSVARIEVAHTASDAAASDIEIESDHPEVTVADDTSDAVKVDQAPQDVSPQIAVEPSEDIHPEDFLAVDGPADRPRPDDSRADDSREDFLAVDGPADRPRPDDSRADDSRADDSRADDALAVDDPADHPRLEDYRAEVGPPDDPRPDDALAVDSPPDHPGAEHARAGDALAEDTGESSTSTAVAIGGRPIAVEPTPWDDYNGTTEGLAASALPGANQSWGEAKAHLMAMAEKAEAQEPSKVVPTPAVSHEHEPVDVPAAVPPAAPTPEVPSVVSGAREPVAVPEAELFVEETVPVAAAESVDTGEIESAAIETLVSTEPVPRTDVMMDFGTLELVDPESVWEEGVEDFAPWFLAHSQQLGDVLGLEKGLNDARQFTIKSATGVLATDDDGEDVVVVSSKNATADDSDLGRALSMAAASGASSVALVTAALHEDQLKAIAWLNNQTRSGVRWYGIEMRVVRIADSPAAMLFDLVASPPQGA